MLSMDPRTYRDGAATNTQHDKRAPRAMSPDDERSLLSIGIDIGGTFTDFVVYDHDSGGLKTFKVLSTPTDPAQAVLEGLRRLSPGAGYTVVHGSTVATNALLERKGARTAFVTTQGFRDVLQIGRQTRRNLYDWFSGGVPVLVPQDRCLEVRERLDHRGDVLQPLAQRSLKPLIETLREQRVESVALSLLFSFVNPDHERQIGQRLRKAGFFVSASHELIPEFREFERASTTVVNAYVSPVLNRYVETLEQSLAGGSFHIMQSNGGRIQAEQVRQEGVRSILSGPAGGVISAEYLARLAGFSRLVTFDMGGTSTDVSVVNGIIHTTSEAEVAGMPIRVPVLDIHTVGAGGGSLARVDAGGALRVGPESAGADPGPACYGRGGRTATVTDANAFLGRLPATGLLGGELPLDLEAAREALVALSQDLVSSIAGPRVDLEETALGILQVVNAEMERAIRVISVERGHDPRDYVLLSFGGAGGVHACELARSLSVGRVLIPLAASTLSALGMLTANVFLDYVQTVMCSGETPLEELERRFVPMVEQAQDDLATQKVPVPARHVHCEVDLRYLGQSFELTVPFSPAFQAAFHEQHAQRYGHKDEAAGLEIVNLRVRAVGDVDSPRIETRATGSADPSGAVCGERRLVFASGSRSVPFYDRSRLRPGHHVPGPAVIFQDDTTILLSGTDHAQVDDWHNVLVTIGEVRAESR